jgi:hypothetical protein
MAFSELIMTVLAVVAQFERSLISERIKDAKANLRRTGRHQGGLWPFGFRLGQSNGRGRARELIEDSVEQQAIAQMRSVGAVHRRRLVMAGAAGLAATSPAKLRRYAPQPPPPTAPPKAEWSAFTAATRRLC